MSIEALNNVYAIYEYIAYTLHNEISADVFFNGIYDTIYSLEIFPYRGTVYSDVNNRYLIYKKFLIFYEIQEEERLIIIKRIIHSSINK